MPKKKTHEIYDFMRHRQDRMAADYKQIQKRALEDPGTAGDQGEENWANLLRGWLPRTYEIVTKGRIIGQDGDVSPQVDVLALKNIYPKQLIDEGQKIFLAAGVAAAFECKTTLMAEHIEKAVETSVKIKELYPERIGTPYKELHTPIVYGLLAHSHSWKSPNSTPEDNIEEKLRESDKKHVTHPRLGLDLLCVSDLTTYTLFKVVQASKVADSLSNAVSIGLRLAKEMKFELTLTSYFKHYPFSNEQVEHFTAIGSLICNLNKLLAWQAEDLALHDIANYYLNTKISGDGSGLIRYWDDSIYSVAVRKQINTSDLYKNSDEWSCVFPHSFDDTK